jgi:hypothetical protein
MRNRETQPYLLNVGLLPGLGLDGGAAQAQSRVGLTGSVGNAPIILEMDSNLPFECV